MIFKTLSGWWWNLLFLTGGVSKFVLKRKYNCDIMPMT